MREARAAHSVRERAHSIHAGIGECDRCELAAEGCCRYPAGWSDKFIVRVVQCLQLLNLSAGLVRSATHTKVCCGTADYTC